MHIGPKSGHGNNEALRLENNGKGKKERKEGRKRREEKGVWTGDRELSESIIKNHIFSSVC